MPRALYGLDRNGTYKEIQSTDQGELIQVGLTHELAESGKLWTLNYREPAVANNGSFVLRLKTGAKALRIVNIDVTIGGLGYFRTISNPTIVTAGTIPGNDPVTTKLTVFPRNSGESTPLLTQFWFGSTYTGGVLRGNVPMEGGSGPFATGTSSGTNIESIIAPNTEFLIVGTNESGATRQSGIQIEMYEE